MNLLLLEANEVGMPLCREDPRARHIVDILKMREGDRLDAGLVDGPRGKALVQAISKDSLQLAFEPLEEPQPLYPLRLIIGLPRPQTARKILLEATTLGVSSMDFVRTERGEAGYAQSTLWSSGEWRKLLVDGAQQAFCTRLPQVHSGHSLAEALAALPHPGQCARVALDNYEAAIPLASLRVAAPALALAIGSERGWTSRERALLREAGFVLASIGHRVLRTETAVVAATALALAKNIGA